MEFRSTRYGPSDKKPARPAKLSSSAPKTNILIACLSTLSLCCCLGCGVKVVRPKPVGRGRQRIQYPPVVVVHDSRSFWDAHQIKSNLMGLTEFEVVRLMDVCADAAIPGKEKRPLDSGIERFKNGYASLGDRAPLRIVGGLFSALGIEKLSVSRGVGFLPRIVYLTDWLQETLGEANRASGIVVPGQDRLIPKAVTAVPNRSVDWAQSRLVGLHVFVFQEIDLGLDKAIDGGEWVYKGMVWVVVMPFQ